MYKLSEIASKFKVDKVKIIEMLINKKELFDQHTKKKNGVTYMDDRGIEILYKLFFSNNQSKMKKDVSNQSNQQNDLLRVSRKKLLNIQLQLKNDIVELKDQLVKKDMELSKKDDMLKNYQEKLLKINREIVKLEENFLIDKL